MDIKIFSFIVLWSFVGLYSSTVSGSIFNVQESLVRTEQQSPALYYNLDLRQTSDTKDYVTRWKSNRQRLRSLLAVEVNESFQIGLQRLKVGPLKSQTSQIVEICPQLQPVLQANSARGLGLEMRLKLD